MRSTAEAGIAASLLPQQTDMARETDMKDWAKEVAEHQGNIIHRVTHRIMRNITYSITRSFTHSFNSQYRAQEKLTGEIGEIGEIVKHDALLAQQNLQKLCLIRDIDVITVCWACC